MAVDDKNKLIVLSFRGSVSLTNWVGNLNIDFVNFLCTGCAVHNGFLDSWTASKDRVTRAIQQARTTYPGYAIVATGHSLGAAIATLAAADLRRGGVNIALVSLFCSLVFCPC